MEILELINLWMTTLIPFVTEIVKRQFPKVSSRLITVVVLVLFIGVFYGLGDDAVVIFVSIVTALASYGLVLKPIIAKT